jgi:hypothetical protein
MAYFKNIPKEDYRAKQLNPHDRDEDNEIIPVRENPEPEKKQEPLKETEIKSELFDVKYLSKEEHLKKVQNEIPNFNKNMFR